VSDLQLIAEETRDSIDVLRMWLPRVGVAIAFLGLGYEKFGEHSMWVRLFEQIGLGQWFRYFTGAMQMSGAVLVLVPRTFRFGMLTLACTMVGAMAVWIFIVHEPFSAIVPGFVLAILLTVFALSRQA
jgi:uncharacterized membrane protein YphA (DoxX/SURF4 family)